MGSHAHVQFFSGPDKWHLGLNGELVFTMEEWVNFGAALLNGARHFYGIGLTVDIDDTVVWTEACEQLLQVGTINVPYVLPDQ